MTQSAIRRPIPIVVLPERFAEVRSQLPWISIPGTQRRGQTTSPIFRCPILGQGFTCRTRSMSQIVELGHLKDAECRNIDVVNLEGETERFPSLVLTVFPMSSGPSIPGTEEQYQLYLSSKEKIRRLLEALREVYDGLEPA